MHATSQILTLYEDLGCTPDQIARACELDVAVVKLGLLESSSKYRSAIESEKSNIRSIEANDAIVGNDSRDTDSLVEIGVTRDEALTLKNALMDLALTAENDGVRAKTAIFLYNEFKGRNDLRATGNVTNTQNNIIMLNERIANAKEARELGRSKQKLIEA